MIDHTESFLRAATAADTRRGGTGMRDLAPEIHRQRLVVEGLPDRNLGADDIRAYLAELSDVLGMETLLEPVTHRSPTYGWAGWIHWEASGAHFYAWDQPRRFFSVDVYACKPFEVLAAVEFTRTFLGATDIEFATV
jgi:S-adenosylmethionine decarboxylase